MPYGLLADLVAVTHFVFIVFVLFGGLLALRWRWVPWIHIPAAAWGALLELAGWYCPLTPLEDALRVASGLPEPEGGFIERYLLPVIYPVQMSRGLQLVLGSTLLAVNALIYFFVWRRWRLDA